MSSLKEIGKRIQDLKVIAESDPGDNQINYNVKLGRIKRAKTDLEEAYSQYRTAVRENSVLIITTGDGFEEFTRIAKSDCGCFSADLNETFVALTEAIDEANYKNRVVGSFIFDVINTNMDLLAGKIGLASVPYMHFTSKYNHILKGKEDLVKLTRDIVFDLEDGAILPSFYTTDKISEESIKAGYVGSNIPIIMYTSNCETAEIVYRATKNIAGNTFLVTVGKADKETIKLADYKVKTATAESVEKTLAAIAEQVRG